jgi:hypothetical protein
MNGVIAGQECNTGPSYRKCTKPTALSYRLVEENGFLRNETPKSRYFSGLIITPQRSPNGFSFFLSRHLPRHGHGCETRYGSRQQWPQKPRLVAEPPQSEHPSSAFIAL